MNLLEINQVSKKFPHFTLDKISFSLPKGYIMGFIGPNGSGKTTAIKLIMNLIYKDNGNIKLFGLDNILHEKKVKEKIGFVYDENYYYEELTLLEMARITSCFYKEWDQAAFMNYLRNFQVNPKIKIKELSKGMKMKFSLAVALSHNAKLLIMDEPTSGLDPIVRNEFLDILSWIIQDEEVSVLFSTHITSDLEKIADYITFIHNGKIVFSENKDTIFDQYFLVKGENRLLNTELKSILLGWREQKFGFEGLIREKDKIPVQARAHLMIEKPSLDDIMLYTVKEGSAC